MTPPPRAAATTATANLPEVAATLEELAQQAQTCTRCPLSGGRTTVVFGVGDPHADLMFVGEGPGHEEDLRGEPFVGRSGRLLDRLVAEELGLTRDRFYIANVVKCRPPANRDPRPAEVAACRPFLHRQIELVDPRVVVTLGNFATRLLLDRAEGVTQLRGRTYPFGDRVLVPTFHPAAVLRGGGEPMAMARADLIRAKEVLAGAATLPAGGTSR